jgi:phage tail tape-measure protein
MEIRKFIFSIVTKFDAKGFREADKAADAAGKTAARTAKYWSVLAAEQLKAARAAETAAKAQTAAAGEAEKAAIKVSTATKRITGSSGTSSLSDASKALGDFRDKFAGIGSLASTAAIGLGAFVTAGVAVATGVISTGASFESLRTQLSTLTGSTTRGAAAFSQIKDFAKATPFEVDNVTRAFINLKTRGVLPTNETLTALGDLSSAFGGDLEGITGAIAAAARGEAESIERFGVGAKVAGDQVTLSFAGQTKVVETNAAAITEALVAFGEMEGIQGNMAAQSKTTTGVLSNLKDVFSQFLDETAQLGVLDEFKALLADLIGLGGPGQGFAGVLADFLVSGLRALREQLAEVTAEDIKSFLQGMANAAETGAEILGKLSEALRWVIEVSGGASDALFNMGLVAYALSAALAGPAGLVLAAGAVGLAMGNMAANILSSSTAAEVAQAQIQMYTDSITKLEATIAASEKRFAESQTRAEERSKANVKTAKARIDAEVGGLTGGLAMDESPIVREDDALFYYGQLRQGGDAAKAARDKFATAEGAAVLAAVDKAQQRQVDSAGEAARRETSKRGGSAAEIASAEANARRGASAAAQASRKDALEAASSAFDATGSAEKAAKAGANVIEKAEKKAAGGGKAGKKGDVFFDFEKEAGAAAKTQAEKFAGEELQRLRQEGITFEEALEQSRAAGTKRETELKQKFLEAGRVFDASANNILDVLGLRGPGSVLEGRPPPQNLMIAPQIHVTMIGEFNQTIESVDGRQALAEVTGTAGQAAAEAGLAGLTAQVEDILTRSLNLQINRLQKMDAGGRVPPGPEG